MTLTEDLVTLVRSKEITGADRHLASLFLLDALASAYAGSNTPVGRKLIEWARSDAMNLRSQAFLMGSLAHITETDDLHKASVAHPGCVVISGVLAAAQRCSANGRQVLDASLVGFEAMCRIGRAVGPAHYKVWHNTATCGPFGSALAVCELFKLDHAQCVHALGNAGTQSSGLWQFLQTGAMSKHLHAGRASESGVLSAELAEHLFTGANDILEGEQGMFKAMCPDADPACVLHEPDAPWELAQTSIKPWPSCRHTHPAIDAALELHSQLGNSIIESINIQSYQSALNLCDRQQCENEYQAKFSLQHCVATALQAGAVTLDSFTPEAIKSVSELVQQSQVHLSDEIQARFPHSWGASVSLRLADGQELSAQRIDCKGDPELALKDQEMLDKAIGLLQYGGLSISAANDVVQSVMGLSENVSTVGLMDGFLGHVFENSA